MELARQGIDAEAAEDFFGAFGRAVNSIGRAVAPRLGNIAQGAISGATTGAALGPWGMLAGALGGGAIGGLSAPGRPGGAGPVPGSAGALGGIAGLMGGGGAAGGVSQLLGAFGGGGRAGGGPAGALLGLLAQPQVTQALMSMMLGSSGSRTVPVAGRTVPVAAIANMIGHFANAAAAEYEKAYGVPEAETLPGLPAAADSAERAQALADAIALEALTRLAAEAFEAQHANGVRGSAAESAEYEGIEYEGAEYEGMESEGAEFEGAEYESAEFEGAEYEGAEYEGAEYESAGFEALEGAEFEAAELEAAEWEAAEVGESYAAGYEPVWR
jgi:hypothetical protein